MQDLIPPSGGGIKRFFFLFLALQRSENASQAPYLSSHTCTGVLGLGGTALSVSSSGSLEHDRLTASSDWNRGDWVLIADTMDSGKPMST